MATKKFIYKKSDGFGIGVADVAAKDTKEWIAGQIKHAVKKKTYVSVNIVVK